ncbi:distal tail protein Dit [Bacillus licheniformis]|uniref:distal tail protein Dit n=1 Tax=Bacillus licheniformis TaxID=1402 RepID=UPI0011A68A49|nr:distal tail protein Dit [Bacillus licheniformis]TWK27438.1 hypothetical protein CHCC20369_3702 [Bacillus licheniformis]
MIDYKKILTTAIDDAFGQTIQEVDYWIKFNGYTLTDHFFVINDRGRGIVGRELNLVSLPGVDGAKLKGVRYTERTIEIDTLFIAANDAELRKILEEINYILATDKEEALIFSDEPDRTYNAVFSTAQESEGQNGVYKVTLTFVCPDPEKEGGETIFITGDPNNPYTNHVKNGDFSNGLTNWRTWQTGSAGNTRGLTDITDFDGDDHKFTKGFYYSAVASEQYGYAQDSVSLTAGETYTLSAWFKVTSGAGRVSVQTGNATDGWTYTNYDVAPILGKWTKLSHTFTPKSNSTSVYLGQTADGNNNYNSAQITGVQVMRGSSSSHKWIPYLSETVKNEGMRPVSPTVTCVFESDATSYEVQLLKEDGTIDKRIKVNFNFIKGDTLVIDFEKRKVIINGKVNMNALLMLSRWFDIPVGDCTIKTTHKSSISFRKAYM